MAEGDGAMAAHEGGTSAHRPGNLLECKHPIFLSHSGTQKNFVEQLCLDIERYDRYPFFDKWRDSLSIGCNFPEEIFKAIKECHVAVVVLSEDFFTRSKWPMLELAALVKRKKDDSKLIIIPVYLGMTNAQCCDKLNQDRWMSLWKSWEEDSRIDLGEWKETFKMFGPTNGIFLNKELNEVKCREEIVEAIRKKVPPRSRWDDSHVQGRSSLISAIRGKIDGMEASGSYGARSVGIYGMGGVGKTTSCKVLCNDYFEEFEGNVCHIEFGNGSKLQRLQEMLKRFTEANREVIKSFPEDQCMDMLKKGLLKKKVFLAIDNVQGAHDMVEEAKDFLSMVFMGGSIVIVTARSCNLLSNLKLQECMEMPDLDEVDARSLFLYYAARPSYLRNVVSENLLKKCIKRCHFSKGDGKIPHYHPLALKVLGGQLGNDPESWMEKLSKPDPFNHYQEKGEVHPVFSILGRSFEMLKVEDQLLFMDVAIFFPRESFFDKTFRIFEWLTEVHGKSSYIINREVFDLVIF